MGMEKTKEKGHEITHPLGSWENKVQPTKIKCSTIA